MGQGPHGFRMLGRIVGVRSTEQSVWHHLTLTSCQGQKSKHEEEAGQKNQAGQEEKLMYIIAGLGNPGPKYAHTRHNAGFEAVARLAEHYRIPLDSGKFQAQCGTGMIEGQKVLLLRPLTYMNLSGQSLRAACDFYRVDPEEGLIVLYDDISLAPGQLRIRRKGSAGGHNGMKSIIQHLGTQVFLRVKIGVGAKPEGWDLADYVLSRFPESERPGMEDAFERAARAAAMLLTEDPERVMNEFNTARTEAHLQERENS